ncbi:MAG: YkgJ family cysteine cluster protein [Candidatus Adiutrix sp.]|jgi:Fe-S-cluster containining protein|nr:YkgJ family cysteine cluster protein [Candidatus Adiutrix sp.]
MSDSKAAFQCRQCGICCLGRGGVRLSRGEAGLVAAFLKISPADLFTLYLGAGPAPWEIRTGPDNYCLFHQADGRCLIHPVKPGICRDWPFLPGPLKHESAFLEAKAACPGFSKELSWAEFLASAPGGRP